jgi:hypothetical protein
MLFQVFHNWQMIYTKSGNNWRRGPKNEEVHFGSSYTDDVNAGNVVFD